MSNQGHTVVKIIAPGAIEPINIEGKNFFVVYAPVDLAIKRAGGEFVTYPQGTGPENDEDGQPFKRLEVRNPSSGIVTVVIYIGGPLYRDNRSAIIEPRTEIDGWPLNVIANGAGVTFDGIPTGLRIRRKAVQVTNLDPASHLQIRDAAGHVALTLFAQTSVTLPVSESLQVFNASAAPVACSISEIWWTL